MDFLTIELRFISYLFPSFVQGDILDLVAAEGFLSVPSPLSGFHLQVTAKPPLFFAQIYDNFMHVSHVFISSFSLFYVVVSQTGNHLLATIW